MQTLTAHAFRLKPGQVLKEEIQKFVIANKIQAGWMSTCVGSLTQFNLRLANQPTNEKGTGHFEIVSLTGTVSVNGSHLHIAISDSSGKTIGGHLEDSNIVYTTAEIVILSSNGFTFKREKMALRHGRSCRLSNCPDELMNTLFNSIESTFKCTFALQLFQQVNKNSHHFNFLKEISSNSYSMAFGSE